MIDIYFEKKYGILCEEIEEGETVEFKYEADDGIVSNLFLLRKIPLSIDDKDYYDISTPYGYGGPIIRDCKGSKSDLVKNYMESFRDYCQENNIVSEFVRFHPLINNQEDFKDVYNIEFMRETIASNLRVEDPIMDEFSKSARKTTRKALKNDVETKINEDGDLSNFIKIYYGTMDRNDASDFYYFPKEYFLKLKELFPKNYITVDVFYEDQCIASGLYLFSEDYAHAHLSGTRSEFLDLSPAYVLKYYTIYYFKEKGCKWLHYGGGTSNDEEDSLLMFKKKFTKEEPRKFYVGKQIYNQEVYDQLCEKHQVFDEDFFPLYRA